MVGLLDIAGSVETVKVGDQSIDVKGISIGGVISLITRFPELRAIVEGEPEKLTLDGIIAAAPKAIAAIIAAGCGYADNPEAEAFADKLVVETQYELLIAIGRATMPGGIIPFVNRVNELRLYAEGLNRQPENVPPQLPAEQLPKQSTS